MTPREESRHRHRRDVEVQRRFVLSQLFLEKPTPNCMKKRGKFVIFRKNTSARFLSVCVAVIIASSGRVQSTCFEGVL